MKYPTIIPINAPARILTSLTAYPPPSTANSLIRVLEGGRREIDGGNVIPGLMERLDFVSRAATGDQDTARRGRSREK